MMRRNILLTVVFMALSLLLKSQNDTMYVIQDQDVIWQSAVSEIDSIIFYSPDTIIPHGPLPKITGFEEDTFIDENGDSFFPWGFNYTNPALVDLVEDYWMMEEAWQIIEKDFEEMRDYGSNTARIHLQYVKFMTNTTTPNTLSLERLERLAQISQDNGIYLIVTGLAGYRLSDAQQWYDELDDFQRWQTQKLFWETVAGTLRDYPCVFAYDLINEPVVAVGCNPDTTCSWYPGEPFGGYHFIQNISLNPDSSYWETLGNWSDEMTAAIRLEDEVTMVTLGLLPLGPISTLAPHYDILSTHIYPNSNNISASADYVINNQSDKPFLMSEFYNLNCTTPELENFLELVDGYYHGLIGHYMGKTIEEYDTTILVDWIHKEFLEFFMENNPNQEEKQMEALQQLKSK